MFAHLLCCVGHDVECFYVCTQRTYSTTTIDTLIHVQALAFRYREKADEKEPDDALRWFFSVFGTLR